MLKVLIAEDDLMIADMIEEILLGNGFEVCGIARTVADSVALIRLHKPDLAILDLRLADGGLGTEIVAQLGDLNGLGVLYATGNRSQLILTTSDGTACLVKPYSVDDLVRSLKIVASLVATGTAPLPIPRGLRVLRPPASTPREAFNG